MNKDKKYIFLHVPKVAGTSITLTLPNQKWHNGAFAEAYHPFKSRHQWRPPSTWTNLDEHTGKTFKEAGKKLADAIDERYYTDRIYHLTPEQMFEVGLLSADEFDQYFSFCFVRNPWDRLVSIWLSAQNETTYNNSILNMPPGNHPSKEEFLESVSKPEVFSHFITNELNNLKIVYGSEWYYYRDYYAYVHQESVRCNIPHPKDSTGAEYILIDNKPYLVNALPKDDLVTYGWGANWLVPQNLYVKRGDKKVDFVGRYENLENDFKVVAEEIGIAETTRLPHVNSTKRAQRRHYSEYYTREAREKIAEIYADDIKMFGYKFGE